MTEDVYNDLKARVEGGGYVEYAGRSATTVEELDAIMDAAERQANAPEPQGIADAQHAIVQLQAQVSSLSAENDSLRGQFAALTSGREIYPQNPQSAEAAAIPTEGVAGVNDNGQAAPFTPEYLAAQPQTRVTTDTTEALKAVDSDTPTRDDVPESDLTDGDGNAVTTEGVNIAPDAPPQKKAGK